MSPKYEILRERSYSSFVLWASDSNIDYSPWMNDSPSNLMFPRIGVSNTWCTFGWSFAGSKLTLSSLEETVVIEIPINFVIVWCDDEFVFLQKTNNEPQALEALFSGINKPAVYSEFEHCVQTGYWLMYDTRIHVVMLGPLLVVRAFRNGFLKSTMVTSSALLCKCLTDMVNLQFAKDSFPRYANIVKRHATDLLNLENASRYQPGCIYLSVVLSLIVKNYQIFETLDAFEIYATEHQLHYFDWFKPVPKWRNFLIKAGHVLQLVVGLSLMKHALTSKRRYPYFDQEVKQTQICFGFGLSLHSCVMLYGKRDKTLSWSTKYIASSCMPVKARELAPGNFCQYVSGNCTDPKCRAFVYAPCFYDICSVPSNCPHNAYRAAATRQCAIWKAGVCPKQFRIYSRYINHVTLKVQNVTTIDPIAWALRFKSRKAVMYFNAVKNCDQIAEKELVLNFKAMIKTEISVGKIENCNTYSADYDPRFIVSTDPSMGARIGPKIFTACKILTAAWSTGECSYADVKPFEGIYFVSGYNKTDLGKLFDQTLDVVGRDCIIFCDDFSRYDGHIQDTHIKAENDMYDHIFGDQKLLDDLTKMFVRNGVIVCGLDIVLRCALFWRRKSGDMNTTVGNSKLNVDAHGYSFDHFIDFVQLILDRKLVIWVMGDDFALFAVNGVYLPSVDSFRKVMLSVGFDSKPKFLKPSEFVFCSNVFIPASPHTIATQLPGKNLAKCYVSTNRYGETAAKSWVKQQSAMYKNDFGHVPFMHAFHSVIHNSCKDAVARKFVDDDDPLKHVSGVVYPSDMTDHWLQQRYGMPPTYPSDYETVREWLESDFAQAVIYRDVFTDPIETDYKYATLECTFNNDGSVLLPTRDPMFSIPKEILDQFNLNTLEPIVLKPVDLTHTKPPLKRSTNDRRLERDNKNKKPKHKSDRLVKQNDLDDQIEALTSSLNDLIESD